MPKTHVLLCWSLIVLYCTCAVYYCIGPALGEKIVQTLYSNRVTSENKRDHTPPPPIHLKLGCLLFSIGSSNSGTTLRWWGDGGGKALFSPFEVGNMALGRSVSAIFFVADCVIFLESEIWLLLHYRDQNVEILSLAEYSLVPVLECHLL